MSGPGASSAPAAARVAVDIGGTFTDVAVQLGRRCAVAKVPTTPDVPAEGALQAIGLALAEAGIAPADVEMVMHGTTLATNALIERTGARVGLVLTAGFRDVLEIAVERRYDQYDLWLERPAPLVPRDRCYTVDERIGPDGAVIRPLDLDSVAAVAAQMRRCGIESVAIGLLHSYANASHEAAVGAAIAAALPGVPISLSSDVSPEVREYDRVSTTAANAYVRPAISAYLTAFAGALEEAGFRCPLLVMTSSGGMTTVETAVSFPVRLVESGPSGGALLAARIAADNALDRVVSFDMGGTTAKFCVIDRASPLRARSFEIGRAARFMAGSGFPVRVPVIELIEIGAGGGSVASIDSIGRLTVGPLSAGARPGPACYGRGGDRATVTDADAVLGLLDPDEFAGGRLPLDVGAARTAIVRDVGEPLEMPADAAAEGIVGIVDENMANAARIHAAERGTGLDGRTLVAFGGNGPLHAARIADKLRIDRVLVPLNPGVGSAVGFLTAPVSYEVVRSWHVELPATVDGSSSPARSVGARPQLDAVNDVLAAMEAEAAAIVRRVDPDAPLQVTRTAFARYRGQGHEVEVTVPDGRLQRTDLDRLRAAYEERYAELYGRSIDGMDVEILNWAVVVSTPARHALPVELVAGARAKGGGGSRPPGAGPGGSLLVERHWRSELERGQVVEGPALIAEPSTTTFVGAGFSAQLDAVGNIVMTRRGAGC